MPFVSQLMGKSVTDLNGERIGSLKDLVASHLEGLTHPKIIAIEIKLREGTYLIPFSEVVVLIPTVIPLNNRLEYIEEYIPGPNDLFLVRDVLDKQIIDIDGVRVVRVNDLELTRVNGDIYVANVDTSSAGLLRRLGLNQVIKRTSRPGKGLPAGVISWENVELLSGDQPMRLKVPGKKIAELHPADLAEILSDLSRIEGSRLLQQLDVKTLADTLEEVEPDFQASLIRQMSNETVADLLEEMSPDEAADLLAELPQDRSAELLELMEDQEAEDVKKLLTYPEDSAGGIMTTEYIAVNEFLTAQEVMATLRESAVEAETIYYIYVTDEQGHLTGVFSLRDLVFAQPDRIVAEFMEKRVITVDLLESQEDCAQVISKYNLLAVPVVDEKQRLHGIVTADDALDKIIPTAWKKRLPRLYH